ncbi:Bug family tripartite tricarboxylate transporter substrate binding protein [Bordetella flabilis]|uniref:Bug family tripartite tricarboxylate transporter substrate binding protein n=1 Tax=Bordetella flabilis TaxID=463014 RepID=UPI000A616BFF|nr:tripartite tricarboxylate transporter substrate binding protein [Bordetella flabilis]
MKRRIHILCMALITTCFASFSHAEDYPSRPITIEVPYSPGSSVDIMARMIGEGLRLQFNQPVIVENHAGASGQIGLSRVAKAKPDGYTLGVAQITNLALAPSVTEKMMYDAQNDFVPVAQIAENYLAIISNVKGPLKNINDVISWARKEKRELKLGSPSQGGLPHMSVALIAHENGFDVQNISYKDVGPIVTDVASGQLDLGVSSYTSLAPSIQSGRVHLVGITSKDKNLPELPAIGDSLAGYSVSGWNGIVAPAGTDPKIIEKLNAAINKVLGEPEIQERLRTLGLIPTSKSPQEFGELIKRDTDRFAKLVKDIGFQPR